MRTSFDTVLKDCRLMLMDGGLVIIIPSSQSTSLTGDHANLQGTTLEDVLALDISHSPLWSTQPVVHDGEAIVQAHLLFLRAGAKIISTPTYQCSMETLEAAGLPPEQAQAIMLKSVHLAKKAKDTFQEERKEAHKRIPDPVFIALSLGPFGATLKPTQEFRGIYPPPYGPYKFNSEGMNTNSFGPDEAAERQAINALAEFHLNRLSIFASDFEAWNSIDFLAFETVPLRREVLAIRQAVSDLYTKFEKDQNKGSLKPWWISCVFPDGESPEERSPGGQKFGIEDLLGAAFDHVPRTVQDPLLLTPSAFGINCTSTKYTRALTTKMLAALKQLVSHPWIVIYPNGNETYDEARRTWVGQTETVVSRCGWAEEVSAIVKDLKKEIQAENSTVGGVIVGGCCKTGPGDISALCHKLDDLHAGWPCAE